MVIISTRKSPYNSASKSQQMGFCVDFQAVECLLKQTNSPENTTEKVHFVAILSKNSAN